METFWVLCSERSDDIVVYWLETWVQRTHSFLVCNFHSEYTSDTRTPPQFTTCQYPWYPVDVLMQILKFFRVIIFVWNGIMIQKMSTRSTKYHCIQPVPLPSSFLSILHLITIPKITVTCNWKHPAHNHKQLENSLYLLGNCNQLITINYIYQLTITN